MSQPDSHSQQHRSIETLQMTDENATSATSYSVAFGIFQEYYTSAASPIQAPPGAFATVGALQMGVMYLLMPVSSTTLSWFPRLRPWCGPLGLLITVASLCTSAYATTVGGLMVTQGALYSIGCGLLFSPISQHMDEWFAAKKGLAYGVMWAGKSLVGMAMPFVFSALLRRFGLRATLLSWAVASAAMMLPADARRPAAARAAASAGAEPPRVARLPAPPVLLDDAARTWPSYATDVGYPAVTRPVLIALFSLSGALGALCLGMLSDRLHAHKVILISALGSAAPVFLLWGLSRHLANVVLFALAYGFFAGGFSSTWTSMAREIQREDDGAADPALLFGLLMGGRGVGFVAGGPLSGALIAVPGVLTDEALGYATRYGPMILCTGLTAILSAWAPFWKISKAKRAAYENYIWNDVLYLKDEKQRYAATAFSSRAQYNRVKEAVDYTQQAIVFPFTCLQSHGTAVTVPAPIRTTKLADFPLVVLDRTPNLRSDGSLEDALRDVSIALLASEPLVISENERLLLAGLEGPHENTAALSIETIKIDSRGSLRPLPRKTYFSTNRQRTIIQVAAVAEEVQLAKTKARLCKKLSTAFGLIPLQGSAIDQDWSDQEEKDLCLAQQYLVALDTSDKRLVRALPGIGQKVKLRFDLRNAKSDFPVVKLEETQIAEAVQYIYEEMDTEKRYSSHPDDTESESDSDESDTETLPNQLASNSNLKKAMQKLVRTVSQFSETENGPFSRSRAIQAALILSSGTCYGRDIPRERIMSWVSANPWFKLSLAHTNKWPGIRVKPPPGVRSLKAFFQVETNWKPRWPRFLRNPTVKVKISLPRQYATLHETIEKMRLEIKGKLTYKPDLKVQWFEGHVHEKLNAMSCPSPLNSWWLYILDFQKIPENCHRNLHEVFPGLAKHIKAGAFQGEHAAVAEALTKTKAGKVILSGCPGSGKSTFCQKVASAVVDKGWNSTAGYGASSQEEPKRAQIIYTSPQNEQCKDAIKRFKLLNPGKRACRLYGYNRELQALIRGDDGKKPDLRNGTEGKSASKLHEALKQHAKKSAVEHEDPRNPRMDPHSLSSIIRAQIKGPILEELQKMWQLWKKDKELWHRREDDFKRMGHELLEAYVVKADAFFGTLVAVAQCHDHMRKSKGVLGRPALLIVDEVGRLTETHALLGVSLWQEVPTIFAGDNEQFGPIVATSGTHFNYFIQGEVFEFTSLFSAQSETSFLDRAAAMGGVDARLTSNHRVYGWAGEFPCKYLYKNKMIQTHTEDCPATEAVGEWFARRSSSTKNSLFVDLDSCEEEQGTSKINRISAYFVVQLAVDIAREMKLPLMEDYKKFEKPLENTASIRKGRILILVAYALQKMQVLQCLKKISPHEVDKSRISVRTIDDSPSHESEIVIVDLVRTENIGFLTIPGRLKVAATRAQLGTIWVGHGRLCQREENSLRTLYNYHESHKAVVAVKGYNLVCENCWRAGHIEHRCSERNLRCYVCNKNSEYSRRHAARSCPQTTWPTPSDWEAERWMSSPKSVDSVVRDPFATK
ncbi:MFS monocarboxylate transporter [Cordyceps militaris]|uniref:MFS monocarboxylate transporter n=1 Tax=Cordyceps militaris TaxID=73501 RepID=A0A2H4S643_CORMI|nr:MFS monocarboxylate transporter [Cordyceps militaris]